MQSSAVAPQAARADLSMAGNSAASADVRRALDLLAAGGAGASATQLDAQSERQLEPFAAMFQFERVKSPLRPMHAALLLYAPLGVLLMLLRAMLVFLVALVLPALLSEKQLDRMRVHTLFAVLTGTIVRVKDKHLLDKSDIVVANHISEFDALALLRGIGPGYILGYDFYNKMLFFRLLRGKSGLVFVPYASRNQGGAEGRDQVREIIMEKLAKGDKPLMAFPEGGLTNGQVGLLQYHKFLFSLGKTVQPLAIQASDGPFPININDETSTFAANVAWYFFVPWHVYTIKCLPRTEMMPGEDALDTAQRVMTLTADALGQHATPFMYRDKITFTRYKTHQIRQGRT